MPWGARMPLAGDLRHLAARPLTPPSQEPPFSYYNHIHVWVVLLAVSGVSGTSRYRDSMLARGAANS